MPRLRHPTSGTVVDVSAVRAEVLRRRGYTQLGRPTPAKSDSKQAWVDYAISQGVDPDEASDMTKTALVEQFGG